MDEVLVSIVVPVFNAEKYLEQCIVSILNQTLKAFELIIINDGSTDSSKIIIDEYCKKDSRIIFIDSDNKGPGAARNTGIKIASGKFIGFVDADDYVDANMYKILHRNITEHSCELVVCDAWMVETGKPLRPRLLLSDEVIEMKEHKATQLLNLLRFKYDYANWNKLFSLEIIRKCNILFEEKMHLWEDILFNLVYLQSVERAVILKDCFYYYRIQPSSLVAVTNNGFSKQYNFFFEGFNSLCCEKKLTEQLRVFKSELAENGIATMLLLLKRSTKEEIGFFNLLAKFKTEIKELNPTIYLFKKDGSIKWRIHKGLLTLHWVSIFSFVYLAEIRIKDWLRKLIRR
jgi:glycosyltransferase involved in cell wall biosynthesis